MCGLSGIFGNNQVGSHLDAMIACQRHRGPDASGSYTNTTGCIGLGHNRLSIIDLSNAGAQPMSDSDGRVWIVFNGEIYNYLELRAELRDYHYQSQTDTEVILAAYKKWGTKCLNHFVGMFAFLIWDERERSLFAARDRFGVKPLYYHYRPDGTLLLASEINALHEAGVPKHPNAAAWATYLAYGLYEHTQDTFWNRVNTLPAGYAMTWHDGKIKKWCWYDLAERVSDDLDERPIETVTREYFELLADSVRLRFRSDVPVGVNLSGGLDSSTLLGVVNKVQGLQSEVKAFTFVCGDPRYDELPWVRQMLKNTEHTLMVCQIKPEEVPGLAETVQNYQSEPFGGLPTLAYARLFEYASQTGVIVLLDGQGMDEQWAGYDYYQKALKGEEAGTVQGTVDSPVRPDCLTPEFRSLAVASKFPKPFSDPLRNMQYRDIRYTKIPRALRFNDRISMKTSTELREPFLDHRLFELAFQQPVDRKISNHVNKRLLRLVACRFLPVGVVEAPKRPLQTPQREWLRGPLKNWAEELIEKALGIYGETWLDSKKVHTSWKAYCDKKSDNSFYVWQWISLGLLAGQQ